MRMEGELQPRFDQVVYNYLNRIAGAVEAKDGEAYLNLIEALENILLPLAGTEERKFIQRLDLAELKLKGLIKVYLSSKVARDSHPLRNEAVFQRAERAFHVVEMNFAKLRLRLIGTIMRRINLTPVRFKEGLAYKPGEDVEIFVKLLIEDLWAIGIVLDEKKVATVLEEVIG